MSKQVWVVRAGSRGRFIDNFLSENIVAIGWGEIGSLENIHSRDEIVALVASSFPEYSRAQLAVAAGQVYRFRADLCKGQEVLTYDPATREYRLGQIAGDYFYRPDEDLGLRHMRQVRWDRTIDRDQLSPATKFSLGSIATIFRISASAAEEVMTGRREPISDTPAAISVEIETQEYQVKTTRQIEEDALELMKDRITALSWEDMQELVAGLLRAMGYKTRVSPSGADQGRDIVASPDGFGFQPPNILVEVKHRKGAMGAPDVRSFLGGLRDGDKGLYVSTGGFSREAKYESVRAKHHLMLMNIDELAASILEHYDRMDTEARALLPLKKIYWPIP